MSLKDRLKTQNKTPQEIQEYGNRQNFSENEVLLQKPDSLGILETILGDDYLNAIYVSGAKNVYVQRKGRYTKSTSTYRDNVQLENIIKKIAQNLGQELDEKHPIIKFNQKRGVNVTATLPPLSNVPSIYVKNYCDKHANIQKLQESLSVSKEMALILEGLSTLKLNILITGEQNTLKTTLLSAMAKKLPLIQRAAFIDFSNEISMSSSNFTNFDFSELKDEKTKDDIFDMIFKSNQDKVFINDPDKYTLTKITKRITEGYKGLNITLEAKSSLDAFDKIALSVTDENPHLNFSEALRLAYNSFDIVITTKTDSSGTRRINSISQLSFGSGDSIIEDIFVVNQLNEHISTGVVPDFYKYFKENSLPVSPNIFNSSYQHTYYKAYGTDALEQFSKKNVNADILKKFKKDLPTNDEEENNESSFEKEDETTQDETSEDKENITEATVPVNENSQNEQTFEQQEI